MTTTSAPYIDAFAGTVLAPGDHSSSLRSVSVRAEGDGDTVEAALCWRIAAPAPREAAAAAGLPLTAEVVAVAANGSHDLARAA